MDRHPEAILSVTRIYFFISFRKLRNYIRLICLFGGIAGCQDAPDSTGSANQPSRSMDPLASALVTPVHVRVEAASLAGIYRQATAAGVVEPFRTATVAAETNGRVTSRSVEPGNPVSAGQVLVTLDKERALIARDQALARVDAGATDVRQTGNELRRGRDLHAREFISEDTLESLDFAAARARSALQAARAELAAAERVLADTEVRAPFSGIAEQVHVHEGDYLNPGIPVATLADFSRARVKAGITAREAALLQGAERADLTLDVLGADPLAGSISSIARVADAATGTYTLEIWLQDLEDELQSRLRGGMLATVYLPDTNSAAGLTVPSVAAFRRGGAMHVFTLRSGRAVLTPVQIGRSNGPTVEVLEGLAAGDLVVVDGQFALRDGASVTVKD